MTNTKLNKLKLKLNTNLKKLENFDELVKQKKILFRNTEEEIDDIRKDMVREMILPVIGEITWYNLNN